MGLSLQTMGIPDLMEPLDTLIARVRATQRNSLEQLLPFSDASGVVARDVSGWGRNGAYPAAGVTYGQAAPDATGVSVALDPAAGNTYIDTYNVATKDVPAGGKWSALVAVKKDAWGAADGYWLNIETDGDNRLILGESGSDLRFFVRINATTDAVDITTPTGLDWYLAMVVVDQVATTAKLFINGYLVHTHSISTEWQGSLNSGLTVVGASDKVGSDEHDGNAYSYALWSTALTDAEAAYVTGAYTATAYVDVASGNNSNSGLTAAAAVADLVTAFDRLVPMGGAVNVLAPFANPITAESAWAQPGLVTVQGLSGATWYMDGSTTYTADWADETGGVWSRVAADPGLVAVSTIADGDYYTTLTENTGTPTTPSAGEFGVDSGSLYVHLPGSVSANSNTIKVPNETRMVYGTNGDVTLRNGWFEFGASHNVTQILGTLTAHQCTALYSAGNGFSNAVAGDVVANSCLAAKNGNDGFNCDSTGSSTMNLNGCTGEYNADEGASPHSASILTIIGGLFRANASAGIAAVTNSTINISGGTVSSGNGTGGLGAENRGGLVVADNANCVVNGFTASGNTGEGLYVVTTGSVALTEYTSTGNSVADNVP